MKKLLISLALVSAVFPGFSTNLVNWEILQNPVDGESGFPMTASGRQLFADFNNDGIMDVFVIAGQGNSAMGLYKGNPDGTYTDVTAESDELYSKSRSSALFIDINNDGNLDLITVGDMADKSPATDVYLNTGAPDYKFVQDWDLTDLLPGLYSEGNDNGSKILVAFDYNNDGWTDLLINGSAGGIWEEVTGGTGQGRVCAIMKNVGGSFELVKNPVDGTENFIGVNGGSIDAADFNKDGWIDIVVTGYHDEEKNITKLYKNNGNDTFTEVTGIDFVGHQNGETAFIDINNDGYADIIEIGRDVKNSWANFGKLYVNNQDGTFTRYEEDQTNFFGGSCALAIGDVNNDGLNDYFMTGYGTNATFMYNNGDNTFMKVNLEPDAARSRGGSVTFVNINNDGFLDLGVFGYRDGGGAAGDNLGSWPDYILFNKGNDGVVANAAPAAPQNFTAIYNEDKGCYELRWEKATDDTTPAEAIRYNMYVKTPDGKINFILPADKTTGALKVYGTQYPLIAGNQYDLYIPKTEGVEIAISAVDNGWLASPFVIGSTSGIENVLSGNDYKVYATGQTVYLQNSSNEVAVFEILGIDGRVVSQYRISAGQNMNFDVNEGVYLVKVTIGNKQAVSKIVVGM